MAKIPIYPQAAAIPFRPDGVGGWEIALIRRRPDGPWGLPKGLIDPGESAPDAAARECREESGLAGELLPESLGEYDYRKWDGICRVVVFALRVTIYRQDFDERKLRERRWFPARRAIAHARRDDVRGLIANLLVRLESEPPKGTGYPPTGARDDNSGATP